MSTYILKVSSSGEYINKIQWDGISPITISPSHSLELYDYTSSAYIPFSSESIYDTSAIQEQATINIFSGRLEDPILLNGKPIKRLFTDTNDGVLQLISGSQGDLIVNNSGSFILDDFDNTNNIFMSLYNYELESQLYYSSSISRIIDNNIKDYILNLNHELVNYSYLVKNTEITSSTSGSYLKLDVEEIYKKSNKVNETANSTTHQQLINFAWDVDFDLGDKAQSGKFYGDFFGNADLISASIDSLIVNGPVNISGSLVVNGSDVLNPFSANYGRLKFDAYSYDVTDECTPTNYFRFDRDALGLDKWDEASPEKIALSMSSISDYSIDQAEYRRLMINIVQNRLKSIINLSQVLVPASYKKFKILNAKIYAKQFRQDLPPLYYKMEWGKTWELLDMEIVPDLRFDELPSLDPNSSNNWYEYIEFDVKQIETSRGLTSAPSHDDEFSFNIETGVPDDGVEIVYLDDSGEWEMPAWASKLTVICIGAGGGGGGGGAGYLHEYPHGMWTKFSDYNIPSTVGRTIGHDIIMGGGGGAGGNIAWSKYTDVPRGTVFTHTIGEGGRGSRGCYPNEELEFLFAEEDYSIRQAVTNFIFPQQMQTIQSMYAHADYKYKVEIDRKDVGIKGITALDSFNPFYAGDNGGYTSFKSKLTTGYQVDVSADGGIGGVTGTGVRHYVHQYHLICWDRWHGYIEALIPGGGSQLTKNTKGQKFLIGGPGGYGISMPYLDKPVISESEASDEKLNFIRSFNELRTDEERYYRNTAPSLPFKSTDEVNTPNFENKIIFNTQPITYSYYGRSNSTYSVTNNASNGTLTFFNFSTTFPSDMGNTGGGGGTGKAYYGIFNQPYVGIGPYNIPFEEGQPIYDNLGNLVDGRLPAPFLLSEYTTKVQSITKVGKGGRSINNNDLLSLIDTRFINTVYFGEGGSAGHVEQVMDEITGNLVTVNTILPENGEGKGAGGGGGAGVYSQRGGEYNIGQTGGDGNAGRVILIVER